MVFNFKEMFEKFFAKSYLLILLPLIVGCQNQEVFMDGGYQEREVIIKRMNVRCKKFAGGFPGSPHDCQSFGYFVDDQEEVFSGDTWCPRKDKATCEAAERYGLY